jgi:hypothetical protein
LLGRGNLAEQTRGGVGARRTRFDLPRATLPRATVWNRFAVGRGGVVEPGCAAEPATLRYGVKPRRGWGGAEDALLVRVTLWEMVAHKTPGRAGGWGVELLCGWGNPGC